MKRILFVLAFALALPGTVAAQALKKIGRAHV